MKIKLLKRVWDNENQKYAEIGETIERDAKMAEKLIDAGIAEKPKSTRSKKTKGSGKEKQSE